MADVNAGQRQMVWATRSTHCRHTTADDHLVRVLCSGELSVCLSWALAVQLS